MLVIGQELVPGHVGRLQGVEEGVDGAVATARQGRFLPVGNQHAGEPHAVRVLHKAVGAQIHLPGHIDIVLAEHAEQLVGGHLPAQPVAFRFDQRAEFRMHGLGQVVPEGVLHDEGRAALARLGVDADNGLVLPAHVRRVDGQIRDLPVRRCCALACTCMPLLMAS